MATSDRAALYLKGLGAVTGCDFESHFKFESRYHHHDGQNPFRLGKTMGVLRAATFLIDATNTYAEIQAADCLFKQIECVATKQPLRAHGLAPFASLQERLYEVLTALATSL